MREWAAPLYAAVTPDEERLAALLACDELIRNGTTTFGEGNTIRDMTAVVDAVDRAGLRAILGVWTGSLEAGKGADLILLDRGSPVRSPLLDVANSLRFWARRR